MGRSAFLILAHNEFEILQKLIELLDDVNTDFYVHIDAKVKELPSLRTDESNLFFTKKRIDIRWGDISQMDGEYVLWEEAHNNGPYSFYHLISGVHLPLMDKTWIREFYSPYVGQSVLMHSKYGFERESFKMQNIHICTRNFNYGPAVLQRTAQFIWKAVLYPQKKLGIKFRRNVDFRKASNWVSLSEDAVSYILEQKKRIRRRYRFTFCCDEYFVPTELMTSPLRDRVVKLDNILLCEFVKANPKVYALSEIDDLRKSGYVFARKFSINRP